ncbi:hypothetical protein QAD02_000346 [Eretmocerus hayati]|uniref:Uncharacterized protein n=1 Tax=Eretmocerus hayati TaxID=131215 RepID=A0ACC2NFR5_9HYME|nr:hypothetical protein QAD02_000346 [Eretmocerus hayati]
MNEQFRFILLTNAGWITVYVMIRVSHEMLTFDEVIVEYYRGLPRITLPLPSRPQKCMFTLKPITQTVGDFLDMLKLEDPAVVEASVTTPAGIKMGATNRIETLLMDDFHLVINDKVYPVSPPPPIEAPKENLRQLRDLQALISQLYDTFNAREYHAELEREVMLHLEEVKVELEPLEQMRVELEEAGARRSHLATYVALGMMSFQFGFLARLVFWEYSWDVMEPITYFVTYATAMGCYMYFIATRQEYTLPDVFHREHLIGFHKKAKKKGFDLDRYNMLKDEAYELETMLRIIRAQRFDEVMSISLQKLKKRSPPPPDSDIKPTKKSGRFNGLSEDEVKKNTLKDILEPDLDLVFVGINPSLMAAHTGRYYAGPGNHFYKLLYASELISDPITYEKDDQLLQYKIGLTNIVARATRSSADLSKAEIKKGAMVVHEKLKRFKPKIAIFNGKCIYEEFGDYYDKTSFRFGLQPQKVADTCLWVVPSSSARCANFPRMEDKLHFYTSLKKYLAFLKGEIDKVDPEEFRFEGRCKQAVPSTSKMWRRKGVSAFASGGKIVNKETINMDTSEENVLAVPHSTEFILKSPKGSDGEQAHAKPEASEIENETLQKLPKENEDKSDEISSVQSNSPSKPKRALRKRKTMEQDTGTRMKVVQKERAHTIDFVSLIKKQLSDKGKVVSREDEDVDACENGERDYADAKLQPKKALKFSNLASNKSKLGFKVTALKNTHHNS